MVEVCSNGVSLNKASMRCVTVLVWCTCAWVLLFTKPSEARNVPVNTPKCNPAFVGRLPPKIKKICEALETIWSLSPGMEDYVDGREPVDDLDMLVRESQMQPIMNSGVKRKTKDDVDHVFLRFGRSG